MQVAAVALNGIDGTAITVEASVSKQLPGIAIVGLPDTAVAESKQRVRHATRAQGLSLTDRFVLVNLRPAELPKHGSGFDLAIALAVLAVSSEDGWPKLSTTAHIAELGLDGTLRRPRGLLAAVIAAQRAGHATAVVPAEGAAEAAFVEGIEIIAAESLLGAVNWHRGSSEGWRVQGRGGTRVKPTEVNLRGAPQTVGVGAQVRHDADMRDVVGQELAVEALTVAAAGRHHVQLVGPPGAGKTMLAARLPTVLPPLDRAAALRVTSVRSLLTHEPVNHLIETPPFEQPHHTASAAAIIGAGRGSMLIPGALSLASEGVLFLDEAAEFSRPVLDALRQPLEERSVYLQRAGVRAKLPARVQLVLAHNPCPCGGGGADPADLACTCTPLQKRRYSGRISGPLRDRIDIGVALQRVRSARAPGTVDEAYSSAAVRAKVIAARAAAAERLRGTPWSVNGDVSGAWLREGPHRLPSSTTNILDRALSIGTLSLRGYDRALRVAWSIADLAGSSQPDADQVTAALMLKGAAQ